MTNRYPLPPLRALASLATLSPAEPVSENRPVTGSRLSGRKVCKTRAAWQAEAKGTRDALGNIQRGMRNNQRAPR